MKRLRLFVPLVVFLAAAAFVFRTEILEQAARFLIDEESPVQADAIVVLAGSVPDRVLEAVTLYREGYAPKIAFSRPQSSSCIRRLAEMGVRFPDVSRLGRSVAIQLGVPPRHVEEIGGTGQSTFSEAERILGYARAEGYKTILLVTSKVHSRRAGLIFRHVAHGTCRIVVRPSRYDDLDPASWWHFRKFQRRIIFEYEKLAVFYLVDRWRLEGTAFVPPNLP